MEISKNNFISKKKELMDLIVLIGYLHFYTKFSEENNNNYSR